MRRLAEPLMTLTYEERCTRSTFNENVIAVATFGQVVQLYDFACTTQEKQPCIFLLQLLNTIYIYIYISMYMYTSISLTLLAPPISPEN